VYDRIFPVSENNSQDVQAVDAFVSFCRKNEWIHETEGVKEPPF
jgi:hypothetical protein